jgi:thymidylate synthase ThyX
MRFEELKHARRPLPWGGVVLVVDTGALLDPESVAMIQAKYSRSSKGIDAHLLEVATKGAKTFMETNYVGYGHKSIGDCGTTTIAVDGVSMVVAKAIQHTMLYNGQECSTRYIDFSSQPFFNPQELRRSQKSEGTALLESMRSFHLEGLEVMQKELPERHPWDAAEEPEKAKWQKALNARGFDVMRSFLPAGASTNLAWHSTLRHAADHLLTLRNHPLQEVRMVAQCIWEALDERHPHSFGQKRYPQTEEYTRWWMSEHYFFDSNHSSVVERRPRVVLEHDGIDRHLLRSYWKVLAERPEKTEMPKFLGECGMMRFWFPLDFGSFRDIQRHRAVIQRMPLLGFKWGFNQWYLEQLPTGFRQKAVDFLQEYKQRVEALRLNNPATLQYYVPMGYNVPCRLAGDIPALSYLVELRATINVHATLRPIAQETGDIMLSRLGGAGLNLHIDQSPDRFNIKRGEHDIVEKASTA